jgi:hypothetical protein
MNQLNGISFGSITITSKIGLKTLSYFNGSYQNKASVYYTPVVIKQVDIKQNNVRSMRERKHHERHF